MLFRRIAMLRKRSGMSQLQLAEALNISASTIGMYEQGRRTPGLDVLIAMSRVFHVSLDYLITGEDFVPSEADAQRLDCPCTTCYWKDYRTR